MLSCYLDKIRRNRPQKEEVLRQLGLSSRRLATPLSFGEFVAAVVEQPVHAMNPHWRVQYYQTLQASIRYDFIGRFEQFERDALHAGARISSAFETCFRPELRHATNADSAGEEYFTPSIKKMIFDKFRIDFEHFKYSMD